MASSSAAAAAPPPPLAGAPSVTNDPRFRAGRQLIQTGRADEGSVEIFATLLEETIARHTNTSVEAAACYYEYGNALFRSVSAEEEEEKEEETSEKGNAASKAAEAAQKRAAAAAASIPADELDKKPPAKERAPNEEENGDSKPSTTESKVDEETEDQEVAEEEDEDEDDVALALEMMETAWSVLDAHVQQQRDGGEAPSPWSLEQLPRFLLGIGDVLTFQKKLADAADAYSRALPYREEALNAHDKDDLSVEHLKHRRGIVEANVLVAEALLACPDGQDVVTSETKDVLVKAAERVDYARGYYDKARDELQETVYLMAKMAEKNIDVESEKQDVCFLSTLVMSVGITLAEYGERAAAESATQPTKKQKTG